MVETFFACLAAIVFVQLIMHTVHVHVYAKMKLDPDTMAAVDRQIEDMKRQSERSSKQLDDALALLNKANNATKNAQQTTKRALAERDAAFGLLQQAGIPLPAPSKAS